MRRWALCGVEWRGVVAWCDVVWCDEAGSYAYTGVAAVAGVGVASHGASL